MKYILLIFLFFSSIVVSLSQTIKTYSGPFGEGKATYQYFEDENGDRVFNGPFNYNGQDGAIIISGSYKKNKREGKWKIDYKNYQYLVVTISEGSIIGSYSEGNKNGLWTSSITIYAGKDNFSGKETNIQRINYINDVPVGEYFSSADIIKNYSNAGQFKIKTLMKGSFDEQGYKSGEWVFESLKDNIPIEEVKKYKKGYCFYLISRDQSTGRVIKKYDSTEFAQRIFDSPDNEIIENKVSFTLSKPTNNNSAGITIIGDVKDNSVAKVSRQNNTGDRSLITKSDYSFSEAEFPGGEKAWIAYLVENLDFDVAKDNGAPVGTYEVIVDFAIDENGFVTDVVPKSNNKFGMEAEVVRVLKKSPKWNYTPKNKQKAYRRQNFKFQVEK